MVIKNLKLFAYEHNETLESQWKREHPMNAPLPPDFSVVSINGELVAAPIYRRE